MRTIKYIFIVLMLLHCTTTYAKRWMEFDFVASKSIYKVVPQDELKFVLGRGSDEGQTNNPVLYGDVDNQFNEIKCSDKSLLSILSYSNIIGSIKLAVCPSESITKAMLNDMEYKVNEFVTKYFINSSQEKLEESGLTFKQVGFENDDEIYYFPVIAIGHGILQIKTVVLFPHDNSNVFVLQYYRNGSCQITNGINANRLCEDGVSVLLDILRTFMNDYKNKQ